MEHTIETCRHFYNNCLAERKTAYEERAESINKYAQLRKVKEIKANNPYAKNVHSCVLQTVVAHLDKAFQAFLSGLVWAKNRAARASRMQLVSIHLDLKSMEMGLNSMADG